MIYCEDCSSYECGCPEAKEIESLRQQLADSQKQVMLLRDALKRADDLLTHSYDHVSPLIREALAATEPKATF